MFFEGEERGKVKFNKNLRRPEGESGAGTCEATLKVFFRGRGGGN
jgi:hypothetical protein